MKTTWSVERAPGSNVILLVYAGDVPAEYGPLASEAFLKAAGDDDVHLFADFHDLHSYATEVRLAWQRNLLSKRHKLLSIHMATRSKLVKMGVAAFGLVMNKRVTYYDDRKPLMDAYAKFSK